VAEAKKRNWKMNVAVADSGGNLVAFQRMDGAMLASIQIAEHKARAAVTFRRPTKVFEDGVNLMHLNYLLAFDGIIASRGGISSRRGGIAVKAARIHSFGPPDVVVVEDVPVPSPGPGEVLVRVMAAGVAPWDAIIREGKSKVSPQPPLTLGSDFSGVVEKVGPGVTDFAPADEVYGVTNPQFCGAQAEFAVATAGMVARKPQSLNHVEAASAPVIAVTAWQMLFQYAQAMRGQTVMVVGAAGNVGAYAVQMAVDAGIHVVAIAHLDDEDLLRSLGVKSIIDSSKPAFEQDLPQVDAILDTVGGSTFQRCVAALKPGGKLVTSVSTQPLPAGAIFFYAEVTTARLQTLTTLFDAGRITARVGSILPLSEARQAQRMLAGAPHKSGKIVLQIGHPQQGLL
jgi:NADPH:quinone reductase-like Zn-dependent oxidoreductase